MRKILIVDADDQVTAVLELKLRQQGYDVKSLSRTVNAIKVVKEFAPNLIISEMELPELTGVDFLKRVKMNPETMDIPFIFLSSSRNVEDKILAHEMGAEAFFMKPIFIKVLIHRINDFFDQEKFNELLSSSKNMNEFKGDLSSISVIDILNIIAENRSSGVVELSSSTEINAKMFFTNGAVTRIETEGSTNKNGMEELYKILSWLDGNFIINYKDIDIHRNIRVPHDRLLVKAANWLDDYTSELSDMPPLDTMLFFNPGKFLKEINRFPDNISVIIRSIGPEGSRFSDIIERTDLDRKQTVNSLKEMLELNVVSVEKMESGYKLPKEPAWLTGKEVEEDADIESLLDDFGSLDRSEQEEQENLMETLVPPPTLAQKDTLDPADGISFEVPELGEKHDKTSVSAPSLLNSDELKTEEEQKEETSGEIDKEEEADEVDVEEDSLEKEDATDEIKRKEEDFDQKTEIINTVSDEEELKSIMQEHLEDVEIEKDLLKDQYAAKKNNSGFIKIVIFLFIVATGLGAFYYYNNFMAGDIKKEFQIEVGNRNSGELVKKDNNTEKESSDKPVDIKEGLFKLDSVELNNRAAELYTKGKYEEAVKINRAALDKLKKDNVRDGDVYKKVIMNMGIYLYMQDKNEEALPFAEESIALREDAKSIELRAAILESLGKNIEAASFLREKMSKPEFSGRKKSWMREINRLEKIKR